MSQIKPSQLIISLAMMFALGGCGNENSKVVYSPEGGHSSDWTATHKEAANADIETCAECHGENLKGGISKISCTQCHPSGPTSKHPVNWGDYAYARHSGFVAANSNVSCASASCHGSSLQGVAGSGPACATTCHIGSKSAKHPANWTVINKNGVLQNPQGHSDYAVAKGSSSCSATVCHGSDSRGVFLSGPSCYSCHPAGPAGKHPTAYVDSSGHFNHKSYFAADPINNKSTSCLTSMCHGATWISPGGTGPSCSSCH